MKYTVKYQEIIFENGKETTKPGKVTLETDDFDWSWAQYCRNRNIPGDEYEMDEIEY